MKTNEQNYINERWEQIYVLTTASIKDSINYLFIVNGGGCVAVLAFIGAVKEESKLSMTIVLGLFFLGLALVGVLNIARYVFISNLLKKWTESSNNYYLEKITFQKLIEIDKQEARRGDGIEYFGYASFACILLAGVVGFLGIMKFSICIKL